MGVPVDSLSPTTSEAQAAVQAALLRANGSSVPVDAADRQVAPPGRAMTKSSCQVVPRDLTRPVTELGGCHSSPVTLATTSEMRNARVPVVGLLRGSDPP